MPITGPIPLPSSGMNAFLESLQQGEDNQYKRALTQKAFAEEARQQQLLPYQIKDYQRKAKLAEIQQQMMNELFGGGQQTSTPSEPSSMPTQMPASQSQGMMPQVQQNTNNLPPGQSPQIPVSGPISRSQAIQRANQDQARFDASHGVGQMPQMQQGQQNVPSGMQPNQPAQQPNAGQSKFADFQNRLNAGEEITVRPPSDPMKAKWDRFAGSTIAGIKIPDIKSRVVDGIRYDTYPSGKVIAQKEGPSAQEKLDEQTEAANRKAQGKADIKDTQDIEKATPHLVKAARLIKNMHELLKNNEGLTGPSYAFPLGIGEGLKKIAGKKLGSFTAAAGTLQAEYAKAQAIRSGIGLTNFYKNVKPDESNSNDTNLGMIEQHAREVESEFNEQKEQWERKNPGKKFPFELPDLSDIGEDQFEYPPQKDLEDTAKLRNISVDEVKKLYKQKMEKKNG